MSLAELEAENAELRAKLAAAETGMLEVERIARMNQSTWGGWMRDHAQKCLAAMKDAP